MASRVWAIFAKASCARLNRNCIALCIRCPALRSGACGRGKSLSPDRTLKAKPEIVHSLRESLQLASATANPRDPTLESRKCRIVLRRYRRCLAGDSKSPEPGETTLPWIGDDSVAALEWRPPICTQSSAIAEVHFVADGRDDRFLRPHNGADPLLVERPQVFHGAAAASHDDHVTRPCAGSR